MEPFRRLDAARPGHLPDERNSRRRSRSSVRAADGRAVGRGLPGLVSRADSDLPEPRGASGGGTADRKRDMGTMVWTTPMRSAFRSTAPTCLRRTRAIGARGVAGRRSGPVDYCGGVAQVALNVGGDPFQAARSFCSDSPFTTRRSGSPERGCVPDVSFPPCPTCSCWKWTTSGRSLRRCG